MKPVFKIELQNITTRISDIAVLHNMIVQLGVAETLQLLLFHFAIPTGFSVAV